MPILIELVVIQSSPLFTEKTASIQNEGKLIVVPAGGLDTAIEIKPNAHLFVASKARWEENLETLQGFEGLPISNSKTKK